MKQQYDAVFTTSVATIGLLFDGQKLTGVDYLDKGKCKDPVSEIADQVKNKIERYLDGRNRGKSIDVSMSLDITPFQRDVLHQVQQIPYGETRTYGEVASILNTSPRAVGNACRINPVPIIIPCHRVVAADGPGGYSGATVGEIFNIKFQLLDLEGAL